MPSKETQDQVKALIAWFQSQEIPPAQGVLVMSTLLIMAIKDIARKDGSDPMKGCEALYRDMKANFQKAK